MLHCVNMPKQDSLPLSPSSKAIAALEKQSQPQESEHPCQNQAIASEPEKAELSAVSELRQRDRVLEATAAAANALLTIENFDNAVNTALQIIGESLDNDRVVVLQNIHRPSEPLPYWQILYKWDSPHAVPQIAHSEVVQGSYAGIEAWYERLSQGQSMSCLLEDMLEPFRSFMAELGVKAIHSVPIVVEGKYWGNVGFDDCRQSKRRDLAEMAALKTIANCIGSAIERHRIQQALLQAKQERVAELAKANAVLRRSLTLLANEPSLDKFLGYALQAIADQLGDRSGAVYLYNEAYKTTILHLNYEDGHLQQGAQIVHPGAAPNPPRQWDAQYLPQLRQNQVLIHHESEFASPAYAPYRQGNAARAIKTLLFVPLLFGEQLLGTITLRSTQHRDYKPEELELARALAHQATLAIQLTQLAEQQRQTAVLEERNRLARDIHDTLAQVLTGVIVQLQAAENLYATDSQNQKMHLVQARRLAQQGLTEARRSVQALRPQILEQGDLSGALSTLLQQMTLNTILRTTFQVHGKSYRLSPEVESHLLRIGQEALTNVLQHAHADELVMELVYQPERVQLRVRDNGCGFDLDRLKERKGIMGYGLLGMRERSHWIGAVLTIATQPGHGTDIRVEICNEALVPVEEEPLSREIRVLIADDHPIVLQGLAAMIGQQPGMTVVAEARHGREAVDLFRCHQPDIALIDLRMPVMDGVEATAIIREECPDARIILLTTYDTDEDIYRGLQAGAMAYLLKGSQQNELLEVIRAVDTGQKRILPEVAAKLATRITRPELTNRELEVLHLIVLGQSNKEISTGLQVSEGTVRAHVNNLLSKLRVRDRTQAATLAIKQGLVRLE